VDVIVAQHQGFCFGVRRALDTVNDLGEALILGDLIHNRQVVEDLTRRGKKVVQDITGSETLPVVVTAHGTTQDKKDRLSTLTAPVVDTTCPLVTAIYRKAAALERLGYPVLIVGDSKHVEVKGIASRLTAPFVANTLDEIKDLELPERLGVVCQSTYLEEKLQEIVAYLKTQVHDLRVEDTICSATRQRQRAVKDLAPRVDIMIVVGGYNSSNTRKLAQLSSHYVETHQAESQADLLPEWFAGRQVVGLAAGASTPDETICAVQRAIEDIQ
jgi:(E)-4-hydroxy-3-methyl-but-2-enyl pyrophosphate reductase